MDDKEAKDLGCLVAENDKKAEASQSIFSENIEILSDNVYVQKTSQKVGL